MDVVVTGSSGLIGSALVSALKAAGHRPIAMVRSAPKGDQIGWDPAKGTIDAASLEGIDAVVHLAGAGIGDHRWSDAYKREIKDSRTKGTALLGETLASLDKRPHVLLSGSAVGYYGDRGEETCTESSAPGTGFLADVCVAWEQAAGLAPAAGIRTCFLRTGIVLSADGGALRKQLPIFKLGFGGTIAGGRQWWSWITIDDHVAAMMHLLASDVAGPVNLTAPNPATNREFTRALGATLRRPTALPIPKFGPKLLLGGELAKALLFDGQKVLPTVLQSDGFTFGQPTLEGALRHVLGRSAAA
ncbi:MAG: TIGR01777 family oxidoreductase [Acidimicrobiia bacterium]